MKLPTDNIYWVVQKRSHAFATWKPIALFSTRTDAHDFQATMGGGYKYKVDRVELMDGKV